MGKLIVIEGLDGSGKGTQSALLGARLAEMGVRSRVISFPDYGDPSSALVRMYLSGEFGEEPESVSPYAAGSFYACDRYASFVRHWRDDYVNGAVIVADRYVTSNFIHQMSKLSESDWDDYAKWTDDYEYVRLGLPRPDIVIFLDLPVETSQKLMSTRYQGDDRKKDIHERAVGYLKKCRRCAGYAAETFGWARINCESEQNNLKPVEEIHHMIIKEIAKVGIKC